MTSTVPPERPPVARACPTCGKELPPDTDQCPTCGVAKASPGYKFCPVCGNEMLLRAQKCLECDEYVNWKGPLMSVKGLVTFVVATITSVIAIILAWRNVFPPPTPDPTQTTPPVQVSRTEITSFDVKENTRLTVTVNNTGTKASRVLRDFRLYIDEPEVIEFAPLNLLSPDKVIPAGGTVTLDLEIPNIKPRFDVHGNDFWTRYGSRPVTMTGTVVESDGNKRELKKQMPFEDIKTFVRFRSDDPPPRSGTS